MSQKPTTPSEMVEELQATGKYICGVNGLPCSFCELYCEHRKEENIEID